VRAQVAIVGAGPAGAVAACRLAQAGRRVLVLERESGPRDKICGEFVSVEAQAALARAGVDCAALGAAPIGTLRLVEGERSAETTLPFPGLSLTRRVLDEALIDAARRAGAEVARGVSVRRMEVGDGGVRFVLDGGALDCPTAFLATGKHDLRGAKRDTAGARDSLVGLKMYFDLRADQRAALAGAVEVILFEGGYAGLQLVERGRANLCLLVEGARFSALGRDWGALLDALFDECPHLARRLDGARALLPRPLAIARVPYGFLHRPAPADGEGLFRLGDQAAVIPSFSGDGMAIAMHSGRLAAEVYLEHGAAASLFHARLRRDLGRPLRLATALDAVGRLAPGRRALMGACRLWPGAMRLAASGTRVPSRARLA